MAIAVLKLRQRLTNLTFDPTGTSETGTQAMASTKDKVKNAIDEGASKAKEVTDKAAQKVGEAAKKTGQKVQETGKKIANYGK